MGLMSEGMDIIRLSKKGFGSDRVVLVTTSVTLLVFMPSTLDSTMCLEPGVSTLS